MVINFITIVQVMNKSRYKIKYQINMKYKQLDLNRSKIYNQSQIFTTHNMFKLYHSLERNYNFDDLFSYYLYLSIYLKTCQKIEHKIFYLGFLT